MSRHTKGRELAHSYLEKNLIFSPLLPLRDSAAVAARQRREPRVARPPLGCKQSRRLFSALSRLVNIIVFSRGPLFRLTYPKYTANTQWLRPGRLRGSGGGGRTMGTSSKAPCRAGTAPGSRPGWGGHLRMAEKRRSSLVCAPETGLSERPRQTPLQSLLSFFFLLFFFYYSWSFLFLALQSGTRTTTRAVITDWAKSCYH